MPAGQEFQTRKPALNRAHQPCQGFCSLLGNLQESLEESRPVDRDEESINCNENTIIDNIDPGGGVGNTRILSS